MTVERVIIGKLIVYSYGTLSDIIITDATFTDIKFLGNYYSC